MIFVVRCLCVIVFAVLSLYLIAYQFSHPDMTETRLFIENWPVVGVAFVAFVGAVFTWSRS